MRWTWLALLYMAGIFAVSSIPDTGEGIGSRILIAPPRLQNLLHVPVYAGLAWLWWRARLARGTTSRRAALLGAAIAVAYGVVDEIHQAFVPGRFASVADALLNAAGAAALVSWVFLRHRCRSPRA